MEQLKERAGSTWFSSKALLLVSAIFAFAFWAVSSPVMADGGWKVVSTSGKAMIERAGFQPISASSERRIEPGDRIETGRDGRVVLRKGSSTIVVAPGSVIQVPVENTGFFTRIFQEIGTSLFKVDRRSSPHFEVQTPHLVAVVKGTTFTVKAGRGADTVHVVEGAVGVASASGANSVLIRPGETARVSAGGDGGVTVLGRGDGQSSPEHRRIDPVNVEPEGGDAGTGTSPGTGGTQTASVNSVGGADTGGAFSSVVTPIGLSIDITSASNGLVRAAEASAKSPAPRGSDNGGSGRGKGARLGNGGLGNGGLGNGATISVASTARVSDRSPGKSGRLTAFGQTVSASVRGSAPGKAGGGSGSVGASVSASNPGNGGGNAGGNAGNGNAGGNSGNGNSGGGNPGKGVAGGGSQGGGKQGGGNQGGGNQGGGNQSGGNQGGGNSGATVASTTPGGGNTGGGNSGGGSPVGGSSGGGNSGGGTAAPSGNGAGTSGGGNSGGGNSGGGNSGGGNSGGGNAGGKGKS